jgi:hypothetical protein
LYALGAPGLNLSARVVCPWTLSARSFGPQEAFATGRYLMDSAAEVQESALPSHTASSDNQATFEQQDRDASLI